MARSSVAIISHWHHLIENFSASGLLFYERVEAAVRAREVPDVGFSRVEFKEGGLASAKREYLRIERRNVAFDICAAPYGNGFFFSWWLTRVGPKHPFLYLIGFLVIIFVAPPLISIPFRNSCGYLFAVPVAALAVIAGLAFLARQEAFGPEDHILAVPVLGWIYNTIFGPVTYYSLDTALMFQESVRRAVNEVIEGVLSARGLRVLTDEQKRPTIRDLAG